MVILAVAAVLLALGVLALPLFDTRGDREHILSDFAAPQGATLLTIESKGSRTGLFNDGPESTAFFAAPWEEGKLCERLKEAARRLSSGSVRPSDSYPHAACAYFTLVPSGWPARVVNVWNYAGTVRTYPPGQVPAPHRWRADGLPPTHALVVVNLGAKIGY